MKRLFALAALLLLTALGASAQTHTVALKWNASTGTVSGYNVLRGTASGGPYTTINPALVPGLTYTDTVPCGQTFFYVVNDQNAAGVLSVNSNQATAAIPACSTPPPTLFTMTAAPTSLAFTSTAGSTPNSQSVVLHDNNTNCTPYTAAVNQPWLSVTPASACASGTEVVSVNVTGLAPGTYTGALVITSAQESNSPFSVPITLTVTGAAPPPPPTGLTITITEMMSGKKLEVAGNWTDTGSAVTAYVLFGGGKVLKSGNGVSSVSYSGTPVASIFLAVCDAAGTCGVCDATTGSCAVRHA